MKPTERGYQPETGYLTNLVRTLPMFNDEEARSQIPVSLYEECEGCGVPMITPVSEYGERTCFRFFDYDPLLDSSSMSHIHWARIAGDIVDMMDKFDSFIVLHGTDTMSFTATALSFFLEGLRKTVVITGSQIPLCRPRNDGMMNLLGALSFAGHFKVPEVVVYFNNKVFRGNRCCKEDANNLDAFNSPNLRPLGVCGISMEMEWGMIRPLPSTNALQLNTKFCDDVTILRIFPGEFNNINATLQGVKGMVLQTFGAGNCPENENLLKALKDATGRGVVVVNVTQCIRGEVEAHYATGTALVEAGVVGAGDMTPEAALVKLGWLLGQPNTTPEEVRSRFQQDLRGEVTVHSKNKQFSLENNSFVKAVYATMRSTGYLTGKEEANVLDDIRKALEPTLVCQFASTGDIAELNTVFEESNTISPNVSDYDGRTGLHLAAAGNNLPVIEYLFDKGASATPKDRFGRTPLREAIENASTNKDSSIDVRCINALLSHGAEIGLADFEIGSILCRLAAEDKGTRLAAWIAGGVDINTGDYDSRTALHISASMGNVSLSKMLIGAGSNTSIEDTFGNTPAADALRGGYEEIYNFITANS